MFKRLLLIGLLCIGLIALVNTEATARCRIIGGVLACTDVCSDTFLQGVGNVDVNNVAVCATLYLDKVSGLCLNKPLNSTNAEGVVFFPNIAIAADTLLKAEYLSGERGSATVPICWTNVGEDGDGWAVIEEQVQSWINTHFNCDNDPYFGPYPLPDLCSGFGICPNKNWWFDRVNWTIDVVYVYHSSYQYGSDGTLKSTSELCRKCTLPGTECGFSCSTVGISECQARTLDTICYEKVQSLPKP